MGNFPQPGQRSKTQSLSPKPQKCCTKYLLVIGICWHLHFNATHHPPPSAHHRLLQGAFFSRDARLEAGRTPFVLFPLPIHLAYARRIFCCSASAAASAASSSSLSFALCFSLCVLCNFLFTLLVACCFCCLNMPQYLAWQRQRQRQRRRCRTRTYAVPIYHIYKCVYYILILSICVCATQLPSRVQRTFS